MTEVLSMADLLKRIERLEERADANASMRERLEHRVRRLEQALRDASMRLGDGHDAG